ncbi:hypothetical protein ADUPG1_000522, partial [Aduncisulcus paluster]
HQHIIDKKTTPSTISPSVQLLFDGVVSLCSGNKISGASTMLNHGWQHERLSSSMKEMPGMEQGEDDSSRDSHSKNSTMMSDHQKEKQSRSTPGKSNLHGPLFSHVVQTMRKDQIEVKKERKRRELVKKEERQRLVKVEEEEEKRAARARKRQLLVDQEMQKKKDKEKGAVYSVSYLFPHSPHKSLSSPKSASLQQPLRISSTDSSRSVAIVPSKKRIPKVKPPPPPSKASSLEPMLSKAAPKPLSSPGVSFSSLMSFEDIMKESDDFLASVNATLEMAKEG